MRGATIHADRVIMWVTISIHTPHAGSDKGIWSITWTI